MMLTISLMASLVALLALGADGQVEYCTKGSTYAYDLQDCNKFYACVGDIAYRMSCPSATVFSLKKEGCVYPNDPYAEDCLQQYSKQLGGVASKSAGPMTDHSDVGVGHNGHTGAGNDHPGDSRIHPGGHSGDSRNHHGGHSGDSRIHPGGHSGDSRIHQGGHSGDSRGHQGGHQDGGAHDQLAPMKDGRDNSHVPNTRNNNANNHHCKIANSVVPHESLCHRYYNCTESYSDDKNKYLIPNEFECDYPDMFSTATMRCEPFEQVHCGTRREVKDPCEYAENMCSGPNCRACNVIHPSCVGLPDGKNYWPGREGTSYWVECRKERTISHGDCALDDFIKVFSLEQKKCVPYIDAIKEICPFSPTNLPHPYECHMYFDCHTTSTHKDTSKPMTCPYPNLYSVNTGKCEKADDVDCGTRHEAKTPCDYMPSECVDPTFASCKGMPDGKNVFKTREGTPHYVECKNERTVKKEMCPMDKRGMFKQFSPAMGDCMGV